jgi:uncharacterized membrane protein
MDVVTDAVHARLSSRSVGLPILVGVSGMGANLLYFFATHTGLLSTVAVVTSASASCQLSPSR